MFQKRKRSLIRQFRQRGYDGRCLGPLKNMLYIDRPSLLGSLTKRHIEKPLPLHTLYYKFVPDINYVIRKHWSEIHNDPCLPFYLPTPPFLAYTNHKTIGKSLSHKRRIFHSTPPPLNKHNFELQKFNRPRPLRVLQQLRNANIHHTVPSADSNNKNNIRRTDHTCTNSKCQVCPILTHTPRILSKHTRVSLPVSFGLTCMSRYVIYALTCQICGKQYVGQTSNTLRHRLAQHKYNLHRTPMSLYSHFTRYHHTGLLVHITFLEQVKDQVTRLERETWWIHNLSTIIPHGLNNPTTSNYPRTQP